MSYSVPMLDGDRRIPARYLPAAGEERAGAARLASEEAAVAGVDRETAVTPAGLRAALEAHTPPPPPSGTGVAAALVRPGVLRLSDDPAGTTRLTRTSPHVLTIGE